MPLHPTIRDIIGNMKRLMIPLVFALIAPGTMAASQDMAIVQRHVRDWLDQSLANTPGIPSYQIGNMDSKLRLDACQEMLVSLPAGYRLVGKTMLRVQCVSGASWSVAIPAQISIQVQYQTAARPLAANQEIREGDLQQRQGDLATLPGSVILDPAQAIGRVLNSAIAAGNPLRQEMLRNPVVIQQNQKVRILFRENGLEVMNEGIALANAQDGQAVRVKIGNGQTVVGIARTNGLVEVGK